jgi:hypothetical protein
VLDTAQAARHVSPPVHHAQLLSAAHAAAVLLAHSGRHSECTVLQTQTPRRAGWLQKISTVNSVHRGTHGVANVKDSLQRHMASAAHSAVVFNPMHGMWHAPLLHWNWQSGREVHAYF